ncbi:hypothetical protein [Pseudonocardia sp. GCM10023141]|uniref:hypothetical protein n=1 Tax=Pseudonocardia sp. GCM10023141 TaxID=3252653 RepID=UPI00360B9E65
MSAHAAAGGAGSADTPARLRQILVIADGTAPGLGPGTSDLNATDPPAPDSASLAQVLQAALAKDAALIQQLAGVPTAVQTAGEGDTATDFAARIWHCPTPAAAGYLTRTDPARARTVQRLVEQAGGPPVLTEEDATAIALAAAALHYLRRLGRDPYRSRILVADALRLPILSPLLLACGFPDISMWNAPDTAWFPLPRAARDADVVIDLSRQDPPPGTPAATIGAGATELDLDRPEGSVITRRGLDPGALIAPGLLRAITEHPAGALPFGLGVYQMCAEAVARAMLARPRSDDLFRAGPIPSAAAQSIATAVALSIHVALTTQDQDNGWPPRSQRRPHAGG